MAANITSAAVAAANLTAANLTAANLAADNLTAVNITSVAVSAATNATTLMAMGDPNWRRIGIEILHFILSCIEVIGSMSHWFTFANVNLAVDSSEALKAMAPTAVAFNHCKREIEDDMGRIVSLLVEPVRRYVYGNFDYIDLFNLPESCVGFFKKWERVNHHPADSVLEKGRQKPHPQHDYEKTGAPTLPFETFGDPIVLSPNQVRYRHPPVCISRYQKLYSKGKLPETGLYKEDKADNHAVHSGGGPPANIGGDIHPGAQIDHPFAETFDDLDVPVGFGGGQLIPSPWDPSHCFQKNEEISHP